MSVPPQRAPPSTARSPRQQDGRSLPNREAARVQPAHIRATLVGTGSVAEAAKADSQGQRVMTWPLDQSHEEAPPDHRRDLFVSPKSHQLPGHPPTRRSKNGHRRSHRTGWTPRDGFAYLCHVGPRGPLASATSSHQDPDQVRTNSAQQQTIPPFAAGQRRWWACTTSRRRTCWYSECVDRHMVSATVP